MNDDRSGRLALPYLQPAQAQKEMFHNEALALLDLAVQAVVEAVGENDPPATPAIGQCWIVGTAPAGDWAGQPSALAGNTAGGWRFVAPFAGMEVWSRADNCRARFDGTAWQIGILAGKALTIDGAKVIGVQGDPIADPAAGAVIDIEARTTIKALLDALRRHGLIAA